MSAVRESQPFGLLARMCSTFCRAHIWFGAGQHLRWLPDNMPAHCQQHDKPSDDVGQRFLAYTEALNGYAWALAGGGALPGPDLCAAPAIGEQHAARPLPPHRLLHPGGSGFWWDSILVMWQRVRCAPLALGTQSTQAPFIIVCFRRSFSAQAAKKPVQAVSVADISRGPESCWRHSSSTPGPTPTLASLNPALAPRR
jgi:hypothetical protein